MTLVQNPPPGGPQGPGAPPPSSSPGLLGRFVNFGKAFGNEVLQVGSEWSANAADALDGRRKFVKETLKPSLVTNKQYLQTLTGSNELNQMLESLTESFVPDLEKQLDGMKGKDLGDKVKRQAVKHLRTIPDSSFSELVKANIFQMVVNLVKKVRTKAEEKHERIEDGSITASDLMLKLFEFVAEFEQAEMVQLKIQLANIDAPENNVSKKQKDAQKKRLFDAVSKKFVAAGFPNGAADLLVPEMLHLDKVNYAPLRTNLFSMLEVELHKLGEHCLKFWNFTSEAHAANVQIVKTTGSDGEAVAAAMQEVGKLGGLYAIDILKKLVKQPAAGEDPSAFNYHQIMAQKLGNGQRLAWLDQFLQKTGASATVSEVLKQSQGYFYPVLIHVLASLVKSAEIPQGSPKRATLTIVLENIFRSVLENGPKISAAHRTYTETLSQINLDIPDANTPALREVKEKKIAEAEKTYKAAYAPLVDAVIRKAGLTKEEVDIIFPFPDYKIAEGIKGWMLNFCSDFYEMFLVPQGKPLPMGAHPPGEEEGRRFFKGMFKELMPDIKEALAKEDNRLDMQVGLAEEIEGIFIKSSESAPVQHLPHTVEDTQNNQRVRLARDWLAEPIKELVLGPYYQHVSQHAETFFADSVSDMFAHLANSYTPPNGAAKGDMVSSAIAHLMQITASELTDPHLATKLKAWIDLPDKTVEQQKIKSDKKFQLRKDVFAKCGPAVMKKAGWDNLANIRAPKALQKPLLKLMEQIVIPDQIFRICCDIVVPKRFSTVDQNRLKAMEVDIDDNTGLPKDNDELTILSDGLAEKATPWVFTKLKENAEILSVKLNEKLGQKSLNEKGQAWLGAEFDRIFDQKNLNFNPFLSFSERYLSHTIRFGLAQLALNYKRADQGKVLANISCYMRDLLRNFVFDPRLSEMIRIYCKQTTRLRELDKELSDARKEALRASPHVSAALVTKLQQLTASRNKEEKELDDKYQIKDTYQKILKAFEPEVKKLLNDMGFATAKDLPVPYFLKEVLWRNLNTNLLPDLCLMAAEKMIAATDTLIPPNYEIDEYEKKLNQLNDKNLPVGAKSTRSPMVASVYKLADFVVKGLESKIALEGGERVGLLFDQIIPHFYGPKGRAAALKILDEKDQRAKTAKWMEKESPEVVAIVKERLGKAMRQTIVSFLLKRTYHLMSNLERLEREQPDRLFNFVCEIVPLVNDHLDFASKVAKKNHKSYIHEVDPLIMLNEFQEAKKLHPAMPGHKDMFYLQSCETYIQQLEEQWRISKRGSNPEWYLKVDRLKNLKTAPDKLKAMLKWGIEHYLESAKRERVELLQKMEAQMKTHFFDDFSKYLMGMTGLNVPSDIPGGETFWNTIGWSKNEGWQLFNQVTPMLLMEGVRTAFAPHQLNSYMANIFRALNENLKKVQSGETVTTKEKEAPPSPKIKEMEKKCRALIEQLKKILPSGIVQEMTEIPYIHRIPGRLLAQALQDALRQYPLSKLLEMGIVTAVENLPEKLPKDNEELNLSLRKRAEENERDIQTICKEGEKSFPLLIEKMEHNLFALWKKKQAQFDDMIRSIPSIGPEIAKVKEFFDKIFHTVFIDYVMRPTYLFARWILFFILRLTSNIVAENVNTGRKSLIETPIHANLLFQIGDKFKKIYA